MNIAKVCAYIATFVELLNLATYVIELHVIMYHDLPLLLFPLRIKLIVYRIPVMVSTRLPIPLLFSVNGVMIASTLTVISLISVDMEQK